MVETVGKPFPLTIVVLTYNEEENLPRCLASVAGWAGDIFLVDSGSTDGTLEIAESYGARVASHPFETHTRQWAWTLESLSSRHDWVLALDADQWLTPDLKEELIRLFSADLGKLNEIDGFYIRRAQLFRGRRIRWGTYRSKYLLKLFRRSKVRIDHLDLVDHHFHVSGPVAKLKGEMVEENRKEDDIAFWIEKHNRYAALHAREEWLRRRNGVPWPVQPSLFGTPDQRSIWFKQRWSHLPLYLRPALYFFYCYFLRLGFLDGKQGFIFHFMRTFWYRLLVDIHLDDLSKEPQAGGR